jgi:hypothetical protein
VVNRTPRPLFLRERTPEAGWAPENIWKFWSREKTPVPAGIRTQDRPACNLVTTIELSVPILIQIINKTSIKGLNILVGPFCVHRYLLSNVW